MDDDERIIFARTEIVERVRDEFLPRAAFALNENRGSRRGDLPHDFEDVLHLRRFTDDVFHAHFAAWGHAAYSFWPTTLQSLLNHQLDMCEVNGFGDDIIRAKLDGFCARLESAIRRHQDADGRARQIHSA